MNWFNEVFDLATVASGAGLAGGGGAAVVGWAIRGAILRFIVRTLATALITGVGFYFLLGALGFQIVPEDELAASQQRRLAAIEDNSGNFTPQGVREEPEAEDDGKKTIVVRSPFRKDG